MSSPGISDESIKGPKDVRLIHLILSSLGVPSYSQTVPLQLLTFAHRYTQQLIQDSQVYAEHSRGQNAPISVEDVRLAVASQINHSFTGPPPKEFLLELAMERNRKPLPQIQPSYGFRLPPEKYCLTQPNWIVSNETQQNQPKEENSSDSRMEEDKLDFSVKSE
ncbi:SAGA complex/transcription factor TFIID complex subunit Taf9 [Schizosaccharomyces pombe]|uniref:SAGA complex/transcription factor TFIID complex subunit Taf9 n=1 Tax=Schizosaccharomyces pombe (strain 972 / ATCC 24843) TaxID=284812 RepID=TAF9_SCHPO|nr:SAGA complex/ transcription initiation factor Taf9 [Schizosaccharomyces pombe]Q09869.1 RecName: Full=Transcription initiation factor TFIID subunit 9; AltName: Full=TBP-associated factor 9 [Schizosaccharomyces pombe 972h-]CAA91500.1 SAGA complex/ transcription initiation factor Taf9 [Schizosaccharomyces pombe]|eukprot:NP_592893.1 SAGA complex/ transcription initiation factor Taf9 [Schizosaccharomyces pombe]